jgi:hypothetical protein
VNTVWIWLLSSCLILTYTQHLPAVDTDFPPPSSSPPQHFAGMHESDSLNQVNLPLDVLRGLIKSMTG